MEISGKVLREVEFRDRLRGYDTDEVDEFLEKVAVGVDALTAQLEELEARLAARPEAPAPVPVPAPTPALAVEDDTIRRTLVLAQRTADLAVSEAREEAARLVDEAKAEAEGIVGRAEEGARRMRADAEQELHVRLARLGEERDQLEREVRSLARLVEDERTRLAESLSAALSFVRDTLAVSDDVATRAAAPDPARPEPARPEPGQPHPEPAPAVRAEEAVPEPAEPPAPEARLGTDPLVPDVEREIGEDAASAAWAPRNVVPGGGHVGPARPTSGEEPGAGQGEEAEEALWERWAAGRDLGVVPGPADFGERASYRSGEPDRGWSA